MLHAHMRMQLTCHIAQAATHGFRALARARTLASATEHPTNMMPEAQQRPKLCAAGNQAGTRNGFLMVYLSVITASTYRAQAATGQVVADRGVVPRSHAKSWPPSVTKRIKRSPSSMMTLICTVCVVVLGHIATLATGLHTSSDRSTCLHRQAGHTQWAAIRPVNVRLCAAALGPSATSGLTSLTRQNL